LPTPAVNVPSPLRLLEGIVSKRADAAYAPGNRPLWVEAKCLPPRGI